MCVLGVTHCQCVLGGCETQFIMFCRLVLELLIKNAFGRTESDILEYVKAVNSILGIY